MLLTKILRLFLFILHKNICCGLSLKLLPAGGSSNEGAQHIHSANEGPQHMYNAKIGKLIMKLWLNNS